MPMVILLLVFLIFPVGAYGEGLALVEDEKLVHIFSTLEIVAEQNDPKVVPYFVRIFRVRDRGECDGIPLSCPQESLYVSVSEFGEYPDQKVLVLPKAHRWTFLKWNVPPQGLSEKGEPVMTFAVRKKVLTSLSKKDPSSGLKETTYEYDVSVNPYGVASIQAHKK